MREVGTLLRDVVKRAVSRELCIQWQRLAALAEPAERYWRHRSSLPWN